MNFISLLLSVSGFINGVGALFLAFLVFTKNKKQKVHKIFILMCLSITIWALAYGRWLLSTTSTDALLWVRIFSIGATLIPIFHLHWISSLLNREKKERYILVFGYLLTAVLLLFNFSTLFIKGVEPRGSFLFWPIPGPLYHIYLFICYIGLIGYGLIRLILDYKKRSVAKKFQIKFVFIGLFIGAISGFTNFPLWYNIKITPYANPLIIVNFAIYTYAMLHFRLMDIRFAFRRSFLKVILAGFAYGTFYGASWLFIKLFGSVWVRPALISGIFIALAFAILWPIVEKLTLKFSNRYLYASVYNTQDTISRLAQNLTATVNLKKVAALISETVFSAMNVQKVALMVKDIRRQNFKTLQTIHFSETLLAAINRKKKLLAWLTKHPLAVVRGELELQSQDQTDKKIKQEMQAVEKAMAQIGAELILPLNIKGKLIGLILIGEKKSADAYTVEEIKLLETLANQSAIAIQNALLYHNQEEIIAQKTADLQTKNRHLEKLLKMRSEFLDIASHQLRTPISVIKGNLSMFMEGDFDQNPSAQKTAIQNMFEKTEKLNSIINDILAASELDTGSPNLSPMIQSEDIGQITQKSIQFLQDKIKEKKIKFTFSPPREKLTVKSYERYLSMIIDNLLDNAVTYTPSDGAINIALTKEQNKNGQNVVKFAITDTGIGIPEADQKNLFDKFRRAGNANNMKTDGTGIGLFIVKKLVKAHSGGKIGFQSQENKGSTFWFSLPEYG